MTGRALEIIATFAPAANARGQQKASPFGISVLVGGADQRGTQIGFDGIGTAFLGGETAPLALEAGQGLRLHVFVDACLVEVIANNRTLLSAQAVTPDASFDGVAVFGAVAAQTVDVWTLASIWRGM